MTADVGREGRPPLYARLLRLRHLTLRRWQAAVFLDGVVVVAGLLVLADVATAWSLLVLPGAVAVAVKANDVVAGALHVGAPRTHRPGEPPPLRHSPA